MKRLILGVFAVCLLLVSSACGDVRATPDPTDPPRASAGPAPELVVDLTESDAVRVEAIRAAFEGWSGDVWDRQAAAVVLAYGNNGAQADCVSDKGLSWAWQRAIAPVRLDEFYQQNVFVAPPERLVTFAPQVNAAAAALDAVREQTPPEPLASVLDECSFTAGGSGELLGQKSEEELSELVMPSVVESLGFEWKAMMDEATTEFGDPAKVLTCLDATTFSDGPLSGIEGGDSGQGWLTAVQDSLPAADRVPPLGSSASTPAWADAQTGEAQLVTALWECHSDSFSAALSSVEAALPRFEETFAEDIATAEASWAQVRELAGRLGWTPTEPLAGYSIDQPNG